MPRILVLLAAVLLAACAATPQPSFYKLTAVASAASATSATRIVVGPVAIPPMVDRPQIVIDEGGNRVQPREFERWAAPLADGIAQVIAQNLSQRLGTSDVWVYPQAMLPKPDVQVLVQVQRFESTPGRSVLIDAIWTLRQGAAGDASQSGRSVVSEPSVEGGYEALAAAHSRALARISEDIAAAVAKRRP